jgi:hypothetical protein
MAWWGMTVAMGGKCLTKFAGSAEAVGGSSI